MQGVERNQSVCYGNACPYITGAVALTFLVIGILAIIEVSPFASLANPSSFGFGCLAASFVIGFILSGFFIKKCTKETTELQKDWCVRDIENFLNIDANSLQRKEEVEGSIFTYSEQLQSMESLSDTPYYTPLITARLKNWALHIPVTIDDSDKESTLVLIVGEVPLLDLPSGVPLAKSTANSILYKVVVKSDEKIVNLSEGAFSTFTNDNRFPNLIKQQETFIKLIADLLKGQEVCHGEKTYRPVITKPLIAKPIDL